MPDEYVIVEKSTLDSIGDTVRSATGSTENISVNNLNDAVAAAITSGGVLIDSSLTQSGYAADAKATGDAIRSLSEEIGNIQISGSSLSSTLRAAIYNLLIDATYQSSDHVADKAALAELLSGDSGGEEVVSYIISKNLTNVTIDNSAASVDAGNPYTATLIADDGYTLDDVNVAVTMGGEDVTAAVYSNRSISIESVTGNIVITATAIANQEKRTVYIIEDNSAVISAGCISKAGNIVNQDTTQYKYAQIPYHNGMEVYLWLQDAAIANFPPVVVYDNGEYSAATYEATTIEGTNVNFKAVVSGYSADAVVYANMYDSMSKFTKKENWIYVLPAGGVS